MSNTINPRKIADRAVEILVAKRSFPNTPKKMRNELAERLYQALVGATGYDLYYLDKALAGVGREA